MGAQPRPLVGLKWEAPSVTAAIQFQTFVIAITERKAGKFYPGAFLGSGRSSHPGRGEDGTETL